MFKTNGTSFCDQNRLLVFIVDKEAVRQKLPSLKGTKMRESLGRSGEIKGKALIGPLPTASHHNYSCCPSSFCSGTID